MPTNASAGLETRGPYDGDASMHDHAARAEDAPDDSGALDYCSTCGERATTITTIGPGDSVYQPCGHRVRRDDL